MSTRGRIRKESRELVAQRRRMILQAKKLDRTLKIQGRRAVVGRLWHSRDRYSYNIRFHPVDESPSVEFFADGSRFEPLRSRRRR